MLTFTRVPFATRALGFVAGAKVYLIVGAICLAVGAVAGGTLQGRLKDGQIAKIEATHAKAQAKAVSDALKRVQGQSAITAQVGEQAAEAQVRIETRYRTLREKVPVYVTREADARAVVPVGAIRLLDAAAAGSDPDGVSFAAGKSHDAASGVELSTLVGVVVSNYGLANANAQQLGDLQTWVRRQQSLAP